METPQMYSNVHKIYKFSEWLKSELDFRQMSVAELSRISGVHRNTINNYLQERCEPSLYNVQCIVRALGYDLGVISRDFK